MNKDGFVLLVYCSKEEDPRWQEFSLPLENHKVEEWSNLTDLWFHEVLINEFTLDFELKEEFKVNLRTYKPHELESSKCYLICGYKPIPKRILDKFIKITEETETIAQYFLEQNDLDIEV